MDIGSTAVIMKRLREVYLFPILLPFPFHPHQPTRRQISRSAGRISPKLTIGLNKNGMKLQSARIQQTFVVLDSPNVVDLDHPRV
jgi:hypothetical protein